MIKPKAKTVVLDNVIIIDFGKLNDDFVLLNKILTGYDVIVTPEVQYEPRIGMDISKLSFRTEGYTTEDDYIAARKLRGKNKSLSWADISCITVAKKLKGYCATNEKLERETAKAEGVKVIGSLGLLKYAVRKGILSPHKAIEICDIFIANGARLDKNVVGSFKYEMRLFKS